MINYKEYLSKKLPYLARIYKNYRLYRLSKKNTAEVFTDINKKNTWKSDESLSGPGSTLNNTVNIRNKLPEIVRELQINTFLDLPCGDYNWMKTVNLPVGKYIGGDIVKSLVENNNLKYSNDFVSFAVLNLIEDNLPEADIILCRDCIVHFAFKDVAKAFENLHRSRIKYILTTTFPHVLINENIITGRWRALNLQKPPFNMPNPIMLIEENNRTDVDRKCLGVWLTKDLTIKL